METNSDHHEANSNFRFCTVGEKCQAVVVYLKCMHTTDSTDHLLTANAGGTIIFQFLFSMFRHFLIYLIRQHQPKRLPRGHCSLWSSWRGRQEVARQEVARQEVTNEGISKMRDIKIRHRQKHRRL